MQRGQWDVFSDLSKSQISNLYSPSNDGLPRFGGPALPKSIPNTFPPGLKIKPTIERQRYLYLLPYSHFIAALEDAVPKLLDGRLL